MPLPTYEELTGAAPASNEGLPSYDEVVRIPDALKATEQALTVFDATMRPYRADWSGAAEQQLAQLGVERGRVLKEFSDAETEMLKRVGPFGPPMDDTTIRLSKEQADRKARIAALDEQIAAISPKAETIPPEPTEAERYQEWQRSRGESPGIFNTAMNALQSGLLNQAAGVVRQFAPSFGGNAAVDAANFIRDKAQLAEVEAGINTGITGGIGRGIGAAGSLMVGMPTGKVGVVSGAMRAASGAREQALSQGLSESEADRIASHTYTTMAAYLGAGAAAGRAGAALAGPEATAAQRAAAGAGSALASNVATSGALSVIEGHPYGVENITQDIMFAFPHALGAVKHDPDTGIVRTPAGPVKEGRVIAPGSPEGVAAVAMKGPDAVKPTEIPAPFLVLNPTTVTFEGVNLTPITGLKGEPNAKQISETSPPDGGVRAPEIPPQNAPLPAGQGGEGIQPGGQGGLAASAPPEAQPVIPKTAIVGTGKPHGAKVEIEYDVIEAADLKPLIVRDVNEAQTRQREGNRASEEQIEKIATNPDPHFLGASEFSTGGAPIIDDVVLAGNGRASGIVRGYEYGKKAAQTLKQHAIESAKRLGIQGVEGMKEPVLIRRVKKYSSGDRRQFVVESNPKYGALQETVAENALLDADAIGDLGSLEFNEDGSLSANSLQQVATKLAEAQRGLQSTTGGKFDAAEATRRVQMAALAKMAKGANVDVSELTGFLETDVGRRVLSVVTKTAPELAKLDADLSLGNPILSALRVFNQGIRAVKADAFDSLEQWNQSRKSELIQETISPEADQLINVMIEAQKKPSVLRDVLAEYLRSAENEQRQRTESAQSGDIFGETRTNVSGEQILGRTLGIEPAPKAAGGVLPEGGSNVAPSPEPVVSPAPEQPAGKLPTLRPMEKQGDLLSTQAEPEAFKLAGETTTDFDAVAKEQAAREAAQAESDKLQADLFGGPPAEPPRNLGPGAANVEEPLGGGKPIGAYNAKVDEQRAARGQPPLMSEARKPDPDTWDAAERKIESDTEFPARLVEDIESGKRKSITDEDQAVLLWRMIDLRNKREMAAERINDPNTSEGDRLNAESDFKTFEEQLDRTEKANRAIGTQSGRALRIRRLMANEDFTLAPMEARARVAKGEPLTPEETAKIKEQADRIAELEGKLAEAEASGNDAAATAALEAKIKEMQATIDAQPQYDSRILAYAEKVVSGWERAADTAKQRLREKLGMKLGAFPDVSILADVAIIARAKIGRGLVEFSKFSADMIAELGEAVRPYLKPAWDKAQSDLENVGENVPKPVREKVKKAIKKEDITEKGKQIADNLMESNSDGTPLVDMRFEIQKLAENFIRGGIKEREPLIDAVHEVLKGIEPDITRRQTMDLISGYGDFKPLNPDQIKAELRDLKGQMQQVAKLEDIQSRQPLQKTGVERRTPSDTERHLIQQVNEAKRRYGVVVTDPARQLKSALDSRKTYIRNRLSDLRSEIATRERIVKERSLPPTDAELESLRAEYDAVKQEHENVFGKREMTDEQRLKAAIASAERSEAQWSKKLEDAKKGIFPTGRAPSKTPKSAQLQAIRDRTEAIKAHVEELRALDVGIQERAKEANLQKAIAELEQRIAAGDIAPKQGTPTADTQAVAALKERRDALQKKIADARKAANPPKPEEVRQLEALQKRIGDLEAKIAAGDTSVKTGKPTVPTKEIADAKARLKELNDQLREMRRGPKKTEEERAIQAFKTRTANKIADLQDRIARGDFAKRTRKPVDLSKDPVAVRLKSQSDAIKKEFAKRLFEWEQARRTRVEKAKDFVKEFLAAPRTILASYDVSAPYRQGGFLMIGDMVANPTRAARQMRAMFHDLASTKGFEESQSRIQLRPNAEKYDQWGLYLADPFGDLTLREEHMRSNIAEKVPGVNASNRAYAGFLNRQRADAMDSFVEMMGGKDLISDADGKFLANAINDMTGRSGIIFKGKERGVDALNALAKYIFSPRLLLSRFRLIIGEPIWREIGSGNVSPKARAIVALQYGKFLIGLSAIYGLGWAMGATIEKDPRSSDFGKMKFGNTRIDPLGGMSQLLVLLSRSLSGQTKNAKGKIRPIRGDKMKFDDRSWLEIVANFGRSKLAPIPATVADYGVGKTMDFEPVTHFGEVKRLTIPIGFQDIRDLYKDQGAIKGTAIQMLNMLGFGTQTYKKK